MKKIFSLLSLVSLVLTGCLKDTAPNDFSTIQPILEMPYHGLSSFSTDALLTAGKVDPIVVPFNINVASNYPLSKDVSYTTAIDDAKRVAYNLTIPASAQYALLPDSCFSFGRKTGTIKAGTRLDTLYLTLYPAKIDPSKNYMLAISLTTATGITISGNFSTAYFHIIGNVLAGNYAVVGTRYNCSAVGDQGWVPGPIPGNFAAAAIPTSKTVLPVTSTQSTTYIANLGAGTSRDYFFTYDPVVGPSSFDVTLTQSFADGVSNVRWFTKTYNPTTKVITLLWTYNNLAAGAGNDRIISEVLTKQ